jgi:hypothetical protein
LIFDGEGFEAPSERAETQIDNNQRYLM